MLASVGFDIKDVPYRNGLRSAVELARTSRSKCKGQCKETIAADSVRYCTSTEAVNHGSYFYRCLNCITQQQMNHLLELYESLEDCPGMAQLPDGKRQQTIEMMGAVHNTHETEQKGVAKKGKRKASDADLKDKPKETSKRANQKPNKKADNKNVKANQKPEHKKNDTPATKTKKVRYEF
ncbi:hypothetical protein SARC_03343 [Sphaeroforma arctica JP610]|uniref:PARP-type domain-containing protein n=1 Tax=Sphaeroforma arctica JP610 TaxID=667725 RepID=A0A0L0G869_9EUKA|nr:hypothetical protein SARC_03343 [Sphaeroforma arctica JP610]KNC84448.1 hypothetical protein SARC_03343 [Sphaeroforma arctica JP610]|eukprot:XP_014158350.1 hypothetical protein SARC_03343 [Sphaeroforma arctica JP610]